MYKKLSPENGRQNPAGYPVRILGRFAMHSKEVIVPGTVPTAAQVVELACEAVRFTQKANSYPGAIITGRYITAAPGSGKNGSVAIPISPKRKARSLDLMYGLLSNDASALNRVESMGVYVTSDKKKASAADINRVGIVLCDSNGDRVCDTLMDRQYISELPDDQRRQLGGLLSVVTFYADRAYGSKLHQLSR